MLNVGEGGHRAKEIMAAHFILHKIVFQDENNYVNMLSLVGLDHVCIANFYLQVLRMMPLAKIETHVDYVMG